MNKISILLSIIGIVLVVGLIVSGTTGVPNIDNLDPVDREVNDPNPVENGSLTVTWIEVGQGDSILIQSESETLLIDTGRWQDDGEKVLQYLDAKNVDQIDALISTHPHADHIGGHESIIREYGSTGISNIYSSGVTTDTQTFEEYLDAVDEQNMRIQTVQKGDKLPLDDVNVSVLNPTATDDVHSDGVVLRLDYGGNSFLFTGDIESETEDELIRSYDLSGIDVLHAPHHGSSSSSSGNFVSAVSPDYVVFSSAEDSQYGHPHRTTVRRYESLGARMYWTGIGGDITFNSNGTTITPQSEEYILN